MVLLSKLLSLLLLLRVVLVLVLSRCSMQSYRVLLMLVPAAVGAAAAWEAVEVLERRTQRKKEGMALAMIARAPWDSAATTHKECGTLCCRVS
jgi:hypothetical protein